MKMILRLVLVAFLLVSVQDMFAQETVNVTFRANAAAWRDTLGADGLVQMRGQIMAETPPGVLPGGHVINWDAQTTMYLENVGGDYWEGTFELPVGLRLVYKFFANAQHSVVAPGDEWEHQGWENDIAEGVDDQGNPGGNRFLDLTDVSADTVLPLQFINGIGGNALTQYETPYTSVEGTFAVWLRVNMQGWEDFNPANHVVGVRGSNQSDWGQTGQLSWGATHALNREGSTYFYSNVVNVPEQYDSAGLQWKFVVHGAGNPLDEDWGQMIYNPNTEYQIPPTFGADTTVQWKWFDNLKPLQADHSDTVIITFSANLAQAISERGFTVGDTLEVRYGYEGSAEMQYGKQMLRQGFTSTYAVTDTIVTSINEQLVYQYYVVKGGQDIREIYFDFTYPDQGSNLAERRRVVIGGATFSVEDTETDPTLERRVPRFRNTSLLARDVSVIYTVDARPAIYQIMAGDTLRDIQGTFNVGNVDTVFAWGVYMNGPATGGWTTWGGTLRNTEAKRMVDDGTKGDAVAGDSIYTLTIDYTTSDFVGQEFKFGIGGGDNEAGFGNNHVENINDEQDTYTIHSQFGSIYPVFYWAWDFENRVPVSVEDDRRTPLTYKLSQNYPNPFNPATTIQYSIPSDGIVTLTVYNILGQVVAELVDEFQKAGSYTTVFNASHLSSGLYFYRIQSGDFSDVKKMVMIK
jgi:hypothetical protein